MEILDKLSDIGKYRTTNEDVVEYCNHSVSKDIKLLIVCDGMGGKDMGEVAANYTMQELIKWFNKADPKAISNYRKCISLVKTQIKKINKHLIDKYGVNKLGTTLTMAIINKKKTIVFNCGDSRCYSYKDNLIQITEDDSDVWDYYKYGGVDKEDLRYFASSNIINACIGIDNKLCNISYYVIDNNSYDLLLLLTDGITDLITDKKLLQIIKKTDCNDLIKELVNEAVNKKQTLKIPSYLEKKYKGRYVVPVTGRDNASGVIYAKK